MIDLKGSSYLKNLYLDLNIKPKLLTKMSFDSVLIKCLRDIYVNEHHLLNDDDLMDLMDLIKFFYGKKGLANTNTLWANKKLKLSNPKIEYFARKYQDLNVESYSRYRK